MSVVSVGVGAIAVGLSIRAFQARRQNIAYEGRVFPPMANYQNLSNHNSLMAKHLSPRIYSRLRDRATASGVTLDAAIQTGVDNPGDPSVLWEQWPAMRSVMKSLQCFLIRSSKNGIMVSKRLPNTERISTRLRYVVGSFLFFVCF